MRTAQMREKLQAYIGTAEKEKVKAMYTLLEAWIEETVDNDNESLSDELVAEMNADYEAVRRGEAKSYSREEAMKYLEEKKRQRSHAIRA